MMYKELIVGDNTYKCVLTASSSVMAEKKLGENPLNFLMAVADEQKMPSIEKLLIILWASLQKYNHGIKLEDAYDIFDDYIADGHQLVDIIPFIMDVFEVSGYFKRDKNGEAVEEVKNATPAKKA